ncbi:MAG: hypothetical protein CVT89_02835 [Candidatus Altiarchaeales archaeon HGW-Altiarchaeales-2]|nr:MAG: hypothetical protein CVT89_02835 [Candidatus Altiarchaeales archaeon HGW-Altiarchaeales-2]
MSKNYNVLMLSGKGGVGKSTISAAIALYFASKGKKTLLLSTDPAPSLSNIFGINLSDKISDIKENLYGTEISGDEIIKRWKEKFGNDIYAVMRAFADVDYSIVEYIGTAPGIEEEFMLAHIMELVKSKKFDIVVWDTAPMGNTLKLLSIEVCLMAVCIPENLAVYQTEKLLGEFKEHNISVQKVIINNVIRKDVCDSKFMLKKAEIQRQYVEKIKRLHNDVAEIPLFDEITEENLIKIMREIFKEEI